MRLEEALLSLASRQQGCVGDWQARELGATGTEITRLHRSRRWTTPAARVLAPLGAIDDAPHRLSAAVLASGPGGVASHECGAAWWGITTFRLTPPVVSTTITRGHRERQPGELHRLTVVPPRWCTVHRGIAVVRPELAVYQVCGIVHPLKAERAFDVAWSSRLLSVSSARACLADLAERGRNGTRVYRAILDARSDKDQPPATSLESRFQQLLRQRGIRMRRQVDVGGDRWDGRVDFLDEELPVVVEVQSELHHTSLTDETRDKQRHTRYDADGFEVVAVWENDVWTDGERVLDEIEAARRRARARPAGRSLPVTNTDLCS